jgi:uncharacterized membrane protein YozB (DUF420 family)
MKTNFYDEGQAPEVPQASAAGAIWTAQAVRKPAPQKRGTPAKTGSGKWLIAGLLFLSAIPMAAGAFRLTELTGGAEVTPANARFFASPLPVMVHIVSASVFALLGAFQFSAAFRRQRRGWHRTAGRLVAPAGLLVGLSALWMTLFYARPVGDGDLLSAFRLLFGSAMIVSIILGFTSIIRRDVPRHRAWMIRAYAIGLGAGTQALVLMVGVVIAGPPNELSRALFMAAAWVINLAVAEWAIRRPLQAARNRSARRRTERQIMPVPPV